MTTHSVTLDLPETLYNQLSRRSQQSQRSLEDELLALLVSKLPVAEARLSPAYNELIEFLGRGPTAQEIADFRLSAPAQSRAQYSSGKEQSRNLKSRRRSRVGFIRRIGKFCGPYKNPGA